MCVGAFLLEEGYYFGPHRMEHSGGFIGGKVDFYARIEGGAEAAKRAKNRLLAKY